MCLHDKNMSFKVLGDNPSVVLELGVSPKSWVFVFSSVKWVLVKVPEIMFMKEPETWQVNAQERRFSLLLLSIPESKSESRSVVSDSLQPHGLYSPWNSPGQNTGVGSLSLLPTQGSSSQLRDRIQVSRIARSSRIARRFFTSWATRALHADSLPAEPQGCPKAVIK